MTIRILEAAAPEWFTLPSQRNEDEPARVLVRGLLGREQAIVGPEIRVSDSGGMTFTQRGILELLRYGLVDWEGFTDSKGAPVDCKGLQPSEVQSKLAYQDQVSIASRILNISFATVEDKKK